MLANEIIKKYYDPSSTAYSVLMEHSRLVADKAVKIGEKVRHLNPDLHFIEEAAMLHDIGIIFTNAPQIGCFGNKPYICHGYLGRDLLEREGLFRHALVCERHVGIGISITDITTWELDLPLRDMLPLSLEEKIICFSDKFFSKKGSGIHAEYSVDEVRAGIMKYGKGPLQRFDEMAELFSK